MQKAGTIEEYLARHSRWSQTLAALRSILQSTELEETIKWGVPTYTLGSKNVVGLAAFKDHAALWFMHGALLKDTAGQLINAQQGKTRAQRQWRFGPEDRIDRGLVKRYVLEAIANQKSGCVVKPATRKPLRLPPELAAALAAQPALAAAFEQLTGYKKREYAEYVGEARRADTRAKRLTKIVPLILSGEGLNDRYRS
jgi:uncharacterized protein YdeI (YjbR/CyaY-like superfamily)